MRDSAISRRSFLKQSAALLAAGLAAGCGATPTPTPLPAPTKAPPTATAAPVKAAPPTPPAGGTVQYWVIWGANYTDATWKAFEAHAKFKDMMGSTKVDLKGSITGNVLLTAVAAGTPPDAASGIDYVDYMGRGVLRPLDDWVSVSSAIKADNYQETSWKAGMYQGKLYGIPANDGAYCYGLFYNTRLVEAAGLDPNNPPQTWEDCLAWHKKLTKFDASGNITQIGLNPYQGNAIVNSTQGFLAAASWGHKWFDDATGKFDLNNSKIAEAFEILGEFVKTAGPDKVVGLSQAITGGGTAIYRAEAAAMLLDGSWRAGHTAKNKADVAKVTRATWAPVPAARKGAKIQCPGGNWVVLFKDAKNPAGAFRLAEFLVSDESEVIQYEQTGWMPTSKSALKKVDTSIYPGLDFFVKSVSEATEWWPAARCQITAYAQTQYAELCDAVFRGKMTGAQAAAEFQKRCETEYKNAGFAK